MREAIPLSELYKEFSGRDTAYILGAAPCLKNELKESPPCRENSFVFALNSAFMAYPSYDIHLLANMEFIGLYKDDFTGHGIAIRPNSYPETFYEREYWYYPSKTVQHSRETFRALNDSLYAGHSVLIPTLHFVLRCAPKRVILYGVDLTNHKHWDDGKHETATQHRRFPGSNNVLMQMKTIVGIYPETQIFCMNPKSLLVEHGLVKNIEEMSLCE